MYNIIFAEEVTRRIKNDVMIAVVKAFQIAEEMDASQNNFLQILEYGKEQYYRGFSESMNFDYLWPKSWQSAIAMIEKLGYRGPEDYYICLNNSHPSCYSVLSSSKASCKYCGNPASSCIKYCYLPLRNKIKQWCSSATFCQKMTAHLKEKDHWINEQNICDVKKELWDGSRFSELSWFWDPLSEWTLPVQCPLCKSVTSAATVEELARNKTVGTL